ncbi:MAG: hypothetical protein ACYDBP_09710 [Leptospirales bacterium]
MQNMKRITVGVGVAVALTVGVLGNSKPASATGYLAAPTLGSGTSSFSVQSSTGNSNINYSINSSYGNTFPTIGALSAAGVTGTILGLTNSISGSTVTFNPSTLDLKSVASMTNNYTLTSATLPGDFISGQVNSDVFRVGSGATMAGSKAGQLIFTYQFDVTKTSPGAIGINAANISFFNNPGSQIYNLGVGINSKSIGSPFCPTCTVANLSNSNLSGSVTYDPINGTVQAVSQSTAGASVFAGDVSPQFFIASNALYYSVGSMSLQGDGMSDSAGVFVPNTPEAGTVVLFGSGLLLLAFMAFRKRMTRLAI